MPRDTRTGKQETEGIAWVCDHEECVTLAWLEYYDMRILPFGVSIIYDPRRKGNRR